MAKVLLLTGSDKAITYFESILEKVAPFEIYIANTIQQAESNLIDNSYDLCIVVSPIENSLGANIVRKFAKIKTMQILMAVKEETQEKLEAMLFEQGVMVVSKNVSKNVMCATIKSLLCSANKLHQLQQLADELESKLDEIRIIDRAKCVLISYLSMTEQSAHKHIEKQAMDMRRTRKQVAQEILKMYDG